MHLVLMGFKGCGKTHYGSLFAEQKCCNFIDTDRLIEEDHLRVSGEKLPCSTIYSRHGEMYFRTLEASVIAHLNPQARSIIAIGGGAVLHPANVDRLRALGPLVYLSKKKDEIENYLLGLDPLPAFIDIQCAKASVKVLVSSRMPLYEKIATTTLILDQLSQADIMQALDQIYQLPSPKGEGLTMSGDWSSAHVD